MVEINISFIKRHTGFFLICILDLIIYKNIILFKNSKAIFDYNIPWNIPQIRSETREGHRRCVCVLRGGTRYRPRWSTLYPQFRPMQHSLYELSTATYDWSRSDISLSLRVSKRDQLWVTRRWDERWVSKLDQPRRSILVWVFFSKENFCVDQNLIIFRGGFFTDDQSHCFCRIYKYHKTVFERESC